MNPKHPKFIATKPKNLKLECLTRSEDVSDYQQAVLQRECLRICDLKIFTELMSPCNSPILLRAGQKVFKQI